MGFCDLGSIVFQSTAIQSSVNALQIVHRVRRKLGLSCWSDLWLSGWTSRSRNTIDTLLSSANGPKAFTGGKYGKEIIRR